VTTGGLRTRAPRPAAAALVRRPDALAAAVAVGCQLAYPLTPARGIPALTVATVVAFCAASLLHAARGGGPAAALALLAVAGGVGLLAEAVGTATGFPFGRYDYTDRLGVRVADVPLLIPLAWTMMAWPALLAGRLLARGPGAALVVGAWALTAWDFFLDPQMVHAGFWVWRPGQVSLVGIPVVNWVGWFVVALLMLAALSWLLARLPGGLPDRDPRRAAVPLGLYLWTYVGSVVANLAFFDRPGVALLGGIGMAPVAAGVALRWRAGRHGPPAAA
jgi:putative membrane protein